MSSVANRSEDPELREDVLDMALIKQRQGQPTRPFEEYLAERNERLGKG